MTSKENRVFYQSSNSYSTLNALTAETENVWFSCHGLGFLSRYFIRHFNTLEQSKNYIIAPQAPAKYYQSTNFKYVGGSWLTRENTKEETWNILNYFDAIWEQEKQSKNKNLIVFGFSQGVSVSMRWMASRQIQPKMLVIYAGTIPAELSPADFSYLKNTVVKVICGKQDQYIASTGRLEEQIALAEDLFGKEQVETVIFEGNHEMKAGVIQDLIKE